MRIGIVVIATIFVGGVLLFALICFLMVVVGAIIAAF